MSVAGVAQELSPLCRGRGAAGEAPSLGSSPVPPSYPALGDHGISPSPCFLPPPPRRNNTTLQDSMSTSGWPLSDTGVLPGRRHRGYDRFSEITGLAHPPRPPRGFGRCLLDWPALQARPGAGALRPHQCT